MKTRIFRLYTDELGGSWLKTTKTFLEKTIGHDWRKVFTCFSHEYRNYVYLDSDGDVTRFLNWCKAAGVNPVVRHYAHVKYSTIRRYEPLSPLTPSGRPSISKNP